MLRLFLTALCLPILFSTSAWALSCAQPRPVWWPGVAGELSPTPFIVLDNEALTEAWLEGPTKVEVEVVQVDGYLVLRPKAPLKIGATYTLKGTGPYRFKTGPWGMAANKQTAPRWTIAKDDSPAPEWTGEIQVGESSAATGVWGPTSSQTLTLSWKSAARAIAEVVLTRGTLKKTLLLPVTPGNPLRFGQGLCDGQVDLIGEGDWTAQVTLIGPSGRRSATKTVTFPSPVPTAR